jgi:conflict system STAND superfamily ATPase/SIR2-like protein
MAASPYKFLDFYTPEDAKIFFGRERETQILLADILVNRLVVLFAGTGTGKTSLINAGVRPELERLGYKTVFVRVREDAEESAYSEIEEVFGVNVRSAGGFAAATNRLVEQLDSSVVLFFDQFEEFFLYTVRNNPQKAKAFVADVGRLYNNAGSHVQIVFSMRDDFFTEMDVFRDDIPTIFHNDSNLRLRPFTAEQALDAIVKPIAQFHVQYEPELVDRLLVDLAAEGDDGDLHDVGIEPAQLQIVCDTLWRKRKGNIIRTAEYLELGAGRRERTVARELLFRRIEEQFDAIESRAELKLLEALLPELGTRRGTKYVRDIEGLARALSSPENAVRELLRTLEELHLVRIGRRDGLDVVELSHDYLARRMVDLQRRVASIWPRRKLAAATRRGYASIEELEAILPSAETVIGTGSDAELLLRSGVAHGFKMSTWLSLAERHEVDVWKVLRELVRSADEVTAAHTLDLLEELRIELEDPTRGDAPRYVTEVLKILSVAMKEAALALDAERVLTGIATSRRPAIAKPAAEELLRVLERKLRSGLPIAPGSIAALGEVRSAGTLSVLKRALAIDDVTFEAQDALVRLVSSDDPPPGVEGVFRKFVANRRRVLSRSARMLADRMEADASSVDTEADDEDSSWSEYQTLYEPRARGARHKGEPQKPSQKTSAASKLSGGRGGNRVSAAPPMAPVPEMRIIAQQVARLGGIVIIGPAIAHPEPVLARGQLTRALASACGYPWEDRSVFSHVADYFEMLSGREALLALLQEHYRKPLPSLPGFDAVARLPVSVFVDITITSHLGDSLRKHGKTPLRVRLLSADASFPRVLPGSIDAPVVFKPFGELDDPASLVITDSDIVRLATQIVQSPALAYLKDACDRMPALSIGANLRRLPMRLLMQRVRPMGAFHQPLYVVAPQIDPAAHAQYRRNGSKAITAEPFAFVTALADAVQRFL